MIYRLLTVVFPFLWRCLVDDIELFTNIGIAAYCRITQKGKPSNAAKWKRYIEYGRRAEAFRKKVGLTYKIPIER